MSGGGGGGDSTLRLGRDAMAPNPGYLKLLGEFGFPHDLACKALMAVHNESLVRDAAASHVFFSIFSLGSATRLERRY